MSVTATSDLSLINSARVGSPGILYW